MVLQMIFSVSKHGLGTQGEVLEFRVSKNEVIDTFEKAYKE